MLIKCPECKGSVSETASFCPHCGARLTPCEVSPEKYCCPLCKLRKAEKDYEVEIKKDGKRENVLGGRIDHYWKDKKVIKLCTECYSLVSREESIKAIVNLLGIIGCFVYGFVVFDDWRSALLFGITFCGIALLCLYPILQLMFKGEKRLKKVSDFKKLHDDGWHL